MRNGTSAFTPLRWAGVAAMAAAGLCLGSAASAAVVTFGAYQDSASETCNNAAACDVVFAPIEEEGDPTLFIDRISCNITTNTTARIRSVRSGYIDTQLVFFDRGHFQGPIEELEPAPGFRVYNLNSATLTIVADGENPLVRVQMSAATPVIIIACHISGRFPA
jgi:hypothetical protein